jgi:GT2 family glycosyltransferase
MSVKSQQKPPKILLGYVHPGHVRHEFMRSVLGTIRVADWSISIADIESGPLLSRARNRLCEVMLATDNDYLLSVDTDIGWTEKDLRVLLDLAKKGSKYAIVGGHYLGFNDRIGLFSTASYELEDGRHKTLMGDQIKASGYEPVDSVGMGFTLIRREVFEKLGVDTMTLWPYAEAVINGQARGEDITFCIRAKEKGFQSWCHFDAHPVHMKVTAINWNPAEAS